MARQILKAFVASVAVPRTHDLIRRQPFEGLKRALLLSSHSSLVQAIDLKDVPLGDLVRLYNWLGESGDRLSQLGGIECGFAFLDVFPELEATLVKLIQGFLADDAANTAGRFSLLSSLIVMVEGEIARIGIARQRPPFWRRLATIAHASVLEREIVAISDPASDFIEWAMQSRGRLFIRRLLWIFAPSRAGFPTSYYHTSSSPNAPAELLSRLRSTVGKFKLPN